MTEYNANFPTDEARRAHALDEAIRLAPTGAASDDVVAAAERFEDYLKSGIRSVTLEFARTKPEPDFADAVAAGVAPASGDPLPEPKHTSLSVGRPCLGCEWLTLRRKIADAQE